ncbi:plasmid mobilization relaxosome protein MobC [Tepidanaerobacter acetatoxydans]
MTRFGSNMNQIAKRVNSTSNIYSEDIEEIKEMMRELWQLQKSILSKLP